MANKKYTQLTAATTVVDADLWAQSQNVSTTPVSKKVTSLQFWTYVLSKTLTNAGNPNGAVAGTANQYCFDSTNKIFYICTTTGSSGTAVWTRSGNTFAFAGDPNGSVAGQLYDFVYDTSNTRLYVCSTAGTAPAAVWTVLSSNLSNPVTLAQGGTSKALVAANGGIVYSDADSMEILAPVAAAGKMLQSGNLSAPTWSTPTYPSASATAGKIIISDGTNFLSSTSIWPNTVGTAGKIIRSDGTINTYTTSTFADTYAVNTILYAGTANTISGLATANNGLLVTSAGGVPSIGNTIGAGITVNGDISVAAGNNLLARAPTAGLGGIALGGVNTGGNFFGILQNTASLTASRFYTFPDATGTVALTSGASGVVNSGTQNQLTWYAATGTTVSGLATANTATLQTDASGVPSLVAGIPIKSVNTQLITSAGAFTYTPTTGAKYAIFELQAAGGGSGGTTGAGAQSAAGGAAGGGAYMRILVSGTANLAAITGTVGAAGLAGSSGNNAGGTGTPTTLVVNSGTTWSAGGGVGGGGQTASASAQASGVAGAGGTNTVGTNGTLMLNLPGQSGGTGFSNGAVTIVVMGPPGGDSFLGKGGASTNSTGLVGTSFGGGASGTYNGSGANAAGLAGGIGVVTVTEFCTA